MKFELIPVEKKVEYVEWRKSRYSMGYVRCAHHGWIEGGDLIFCPECGSKVRHSGKKKT